VQMLFSITHEVHMVQVRNAKKLGKPDKPYAEFPLFTNTK
jgi:hypothetical protein